MTCSELHRYLSLHLDSELSHETAADVLKHTEHCSACAGRLRAEERLEQRINDVLRRCEPGDEEIWRRAVAALPGRRRWLPWTAAAAGLAAVVAGIWMLRHHELDLAAAMAEQHAKYVTGHSPLGVETRDPALAGRYLQDRLPFACEPSAPVPPAPQLIGARLCYLNGSPAGFYYFHWGSEVVTVAVFSSADLSRFPTAQARLHKEAEVHCQVSGMCFVAAGDSSRTISAVGRVPGDELATLVRAFLGRK